MTDLEYDVSLVPTVHSDSKSGTLWNFTPKLAYFCQFCNWEVKKYLHQHILKGTPHHQSSSNQRLLYSFFSILDSWRDTKFDGLVPFHGAMLNFQNILWPFYFIVSLLVQSHNGTTAGLGYLAVSVDCPSNLPWDGWVGEGPHCTVYIPREGEWNNLLN